MANTIKVQDNDAVEFIQQINSILDSLAYDLNIGEVVFVRIKNWFNQKWLNYSGKSIVHFPWVNSLDSGREESLECVWLKDITIPPFNPNRVLSSRFFRLNETGTNGLLRRLMVIDAAPKQRAIWSKIIRRMVFCFGTHRIRSLIKKAP